MAQRFTNLLVGVTLLVVLFTAYQMHEVTDTVGEDRGTGTVISVGGVECELWKGESKESWERRLREALAVEKRVRGD